MFLHSRGTHARLTPDVIVKKCEFAFERFGFDRQS